MVFSAGSATVLGKFQVSDHTLVLELAHIDGGGEGVLPAISVLASRYARRKGIEAVEWRVHAVNCAQPNPKLRRMLERRGFTVRTLDASGECYWLRLPV